MSRWSKNSFIYERWLDMEEASTEDLKEMLSVSQFGYNVAKCKILWIPKKGTSYPIVVIPTVTQKEIEEDALPEILGWGKRYFVDEWEDYDLLKDGAKLEFSVERLCCCLQ
ncbi:hypothetical protein GMAR_ORF184 [Golden Marseillevirus]|uniref:hypothetical protein n=1 Tax=Golden Marseillevirus TaxID=1720526 RepID=UPI000877ABFF|nr:hypothetical protein GMAR_ORF184 [Golden Marseillevirus]ALX27558.1 hypothetical protein GMAR_ORF184 [Golden Marseillevirus]